MEALKEQAVNSLGMAHQADFYENKYIECLENAHWWEKSSYPGTPSPAEYRCHFDAKKATNKYFSSEDKS